MNKLVFACILPKLMICTYFRYCILLYVRISQQHTIRNITRTNETHSLAPLQDVILIKIYSAYSIIISNNNYSTDACYSIELCPPVSSQPYRIRNQYDRTIGGRTKFSCMPGFIMIGAPELICKGNGKWSNKEPICYSKKKCLYVCIVTLLVCCCNYSCRGMWTCSCYPQWKGCTKWSEIWRHSQLYLQFRIQTFYKSYR